MTNLHTAIVRNDIESVKECLNRVSRLDHEDLCFAAQHASPNILELCLPFTNPTDNQSEALAWCLKNEENPTRSYDIFCVLRHHCNVQESLAMLEEGNWSEELCAIFDDDEECIVNAKEILMEWDIRAQKSALVEAVGEVGKDSARRKM